MVFIMERKGKQDLQDYQDFWKKKPKTARLSKPTN